MFTCPLSYSLAPGAVRSRAGRGGFTLIEILVALAVTLLMMGGVITILGTISASVGGSRAAMDLSEKTRLVRNLLSRDLANATAEMRPPLRPEDGRGYFEYLEGFVSDSGSNHSYLSDPSGNTLSTLLGDTDDVLMFTARSQGEMYQGRGISGSIQSPVAEVVWFCVPNGPVLDATQVDPWVYRNGQKESLRLRTLYRRVLLVAPQLQSSVPSGMTLNDFQQRYDISARWDALQSKVILNSLADLTRPECRFAHHGFSTSNPTRPAVVTAPFEDLDADANNSDPLHDGTVGEYTAAKEAFLDWSGTGNLTQTNETINTDSSFLCPLVNDTRSNRYFRGLDVVATNVLGFDVRAYDPGAPLYLATLKSSAKTLIGPPDAGYNTYYSGNPDQYGCYVDLGYPDTTVSNMTRGWFSATKYQQINSTLRYLYTFSSTNPYPISYDTWSLHYENDGINQRPPNSPTDPDPKLLDPPGKDWASDGIDNDKQNGIDDAGERETAPPYASPLRGIMVKFREYEVTNRQMRESTVVQDFLPE